MPSWSVASVITLLLTQIKVSQIKVVNPFRLYNLFSIACASSRRKQHCLVNIKITI